MRTAEDNAIGMHELPLTRGRPPGPLLMGHGVPGAVVRVKLMPCAWNRGELYDTLNLHLHSIYQITETLS